VYPHLLLHSSENLHIPQDDLLSDRISSKPYLGYGAAAIALGLGCGPVLSALLLEIVGMQQSFWVISGILAGIAVLYASMTRLWRSLLCLKRADAKPIEMGYHLVSNPSSS
jgi:MFS family permease